MKKLLSMLAMAIVAMTCLTSCFYEEIDTFVEWGFAKDEYSEVTYGFETLLASAEVIIDAFDTSFYGEFSDIGSFHSTIMPSMHGRDEAVKCAKRAADRAHSMIQAGHTCPVDMVFVVRIKYNSDKYETVWVHDYRRR